MTAFRKKHPILRKATGQSRIRFPEIMVEGADEQTKVLRVIYSGSKEKAREDDIVCLAMNMFWEEQEFCLPKLSAGMYWKIQVDTGRRYLPEVIAKEESGKHTEKRQRTEGKIAGNVIKMKERSVCIFTAEYER